MSKNESKAQKWVHHRPDVPLSEDGLPNKLMEGSAEDVLLDLRMMAEANPEKVISRNLYRVRGTYTESTWSQYFGSFHEFKRQAGIVLSRQQHKLEREIAKHASVDHYRELSNERSHYAESYIRPCRKRFATVMIASDLHDTECDPFWLRVWLDTIRRVQPDIMILGGDLFDLPEFGKYPVDPREWDVVGRIKFAHEKILGPMREAAPKAQFDLIEGNHEGRLLRHLADATPALRAVLADLHGFNVAKLLGLDQFEMNYIARADLSAWNKKDMEDGELRKNYQVYYDALMVHHFPEARDMGVPGVNGHHHGHIVWKQFNRTYGPYEWHQLGCGHRREASYCNGEKWSMGFDIAHVDRQYQRTQHDYVTVGDFSVVGGQWYERASDEPAF